jgi:hypothetical protein
VFFKEGERATRIGTWNMAYLEWRAANPQGKLTDEIRRQLISRSDLLAGNMTRASNASYQYGLMSIPAQFTSYFTRLMEQMAGKRLTHAEKARVMAVNSIVFGAPIGLLGASSPVGVASFGQYPMAEKLREEMYKRGVNMEDPMIQMFMGGVLNTTASAITGVPTDLSSKVGPNSGQLVRDLFFEDKTFLEAVFGASGNTVGSIWRGLDPGRKWVMSMIKGGEDEFTLQPRDAVNLARTIKSVDHTYNMYMAAKYQQYFAKNGQLETSMGQPYTPVQAVFQTLTGGVPQNMSDRIMLQGLNIKRETLVRETLKNIAPDVNAAITAADKGDMELAETFRQRVGFIMTWSDLTYAEKARIWSEVTKQNRSRIEKVFGDFYTKNVPASKAIQRRETFEEMNTKKEVNQ